MRGKQSVNTFINWETEDQCKTAWQKLLQDTSLKESEVQGQIAAPTESVLEKVLTPVAAGDLSSGAGDMCASLCDTLDALPEDEVAREFLDALRQKNPDKN